MGVVGRSVVFAAAALLAIGPAAAADFASVRVSAGKVLFPLVTKGALAAGRAEVGAARGICALSVEVEPVDDRGWSLYVVTDSPAFDPVDVGKPCGDLYWKKDEDGPGAYRPLDEGEWLVFDNPEGGRAVVPLDVAVALDWNTPPGRYSLGVRFLVKPR
ncbi:MAG: hypothetical protein JW958_02200 [Candidatus Eisenbacteria bacterium]|nr:hypothetical protein [Candidatus Eisenbacteria bacterium]